MFFQFQTAKGAATVTPDDNTDLPGGACVALYVSVTGNIAVTMHNGDSVTFENVPVGPLGIAVKRVLATGTTATVLALYDS
ncbi:MAG: hypothetical protein DBP02_02150 [gamma proteobacterium symbiont of Ctena orbiculata]|nr:MAG: hypothetical protein DBP02_02150 [gamma proteobacterium symbiont of Ctena orbiculata]